MKFLALIALIFLSLSSFAGKPYTLIVQVFEDGTKNPIEGIPIEFRTTKDDIILYRDTTDKEGKVEYKNCVEKYVWMRTLNDTHEYSNYQNMLSQKFHASEVFAFEIRNFVQYKELLQRKTEMTPIDSVEVQKGKDCDSTDSDAEFPGGLTALRGYLMKTMHYPESAMDMGISGKCYLKFIIDSSGEISHITIVKGIPNCPECDFEALLAVARMPKWIPAQCNGQSVGIFYNLPISFNIQ